MALEFVRTDAWNIMYISWSAIHRYKKKIVHTWRKRNTNSSSNFHYYSVLEFHYIVLEFPLMVLPTKKRRGFTV